MRYPKKKGAWHIIERFGAETTICGVVMTSEVRAVPYDYFPWPAAPRSKCEDCSNHEDLPLIVLRTKV